MTLSNDEGTIVALLGGTEESVLGNELGLIEGSKLGTSTISTLGNDDGIIDGIPLGSLLGSNESSTVGDEL